jgi:hypothetical protein
MSGNGRNGPGFNGSNQAYAPGADLRARIEFR